MTQKPLKNDDKNTWRTACLCWGLQRLPITRPLPPPPPVFKGGGGSLILMDVKIRGVENIFNTDKISRAKPQNWHLKSLTDGKTLSKLIILLFVILLSMLIVLLVFVVAPVFNNAWLWMRREERPSINSYSRCSKTLCRNCISRPIRPAVEIFEFNKYWSWTQLLKEHQEKCCYLWRLT